MFWYKEVDHTAPLPVQWSWDWCCVLYMYACMMFMSVQKMYLSLSRCWEFCSSRSNNNTPNRGTEEAEAAIQIAVQDYNFQGKKCSIRIWSKKHRRGANIRTTEMAVNDLTQKIGKVAGCVISMEIVLTDKGIYSFVAYSILALYSGPSLWTPK